METFETLPLLHKYLIDNKLRLGYVKVGKETSQCEIVRDNGEFVKTVYLKN